MFGHFGAHVGPFWGCQGLSWAIWRVLLSSCGASFESQRKGFPVVDFGASWAMLGPILGHFGVMLGHFGGHNGEIRATKRLEIDKKGHTEGFKKPAFFAGNLRVFFLGGAFVIILNHLGFFRAILGHVGTTFVGCEAPCWAQCWLCCLSAVLFSVFVVLLLCLCVLFMFIYVYVVSC